MDDSVTEADVKRVCEQNFETGKVFYLPLRLNDLSVTIRIAYCDERGYFIAEIGSGLGEQWRSVVVRTNQRFIEQFCEYMETTYGVRETCGLALKVAHAIPVTELESRPKH